MPAIGEDEEDGELDSGQPGRDFGPDSIVTDSLLQAWHHNLTIRSKSMLTHVFFLVQMTSFSSKEKDEDGGGPGRRRRRRRASSSVETDSIDDDGSDFRIEEEDEGGVSTTNSNGATVVQVHRAGFANDYYVCLFVY